MKARSLEGIRESGSFCSCASLDENSHNLVMEGMVL